MCVCAAGCNRAGICGACTTISGTWLTAAIETAAAAAAAAVQRIAHGARRHYIIRLTLHTHNESTTFIHQKLHLFGNLPITEIQMNNVDFASGYVACIFNEIAHKFSGHFTCIAVAKDTHKQKLTHQPCALRHTVNSHVHIRADTDNHHARALASYTKTIIMLIYGLYFNDRVSCQRVTIYTPSCTRNRTTTMTCIIYFAIAPQVENGFS